MSKTKQKMTWRDRQNLSNQIAEIAIRIGSIDDEQAECKKMASSMITMAGAFLNPFHMDELYNIIKEFNERKLTEELAKRN